ncbi:MAG TPA: transglycosylase domain-containing protein [Solirubrobacteraceae bacterium]|nr:transglycosylase domain-containing protein [Solirubrobacteraceae bacterium]
MKRVRFLAILFAVLMLGLLSFAFGMFVAVASDLPSLTREFADLKDARSSVVVDDLGRPIGVVSQRNRVIVTPQQIPKLVKEAVISIEDKRFQSNSGVDLRGIARAFVQDVFHQGGVQGASTIEEQFIKNALQAQSHRTIFEKMREAALAYQLAHKWSKEKIITAYLNTIYFGNGAYGIESAAQTYFGREPAHRGCGTPNHGLCVEQLQPAEAALLAGVIQDPTAYDPANHPQATRVRRDTVLEQMHQQGYISHMVLRESLAQPLPSATNVQAPTEEPVEGVDVGYFTSWVQQQIIERYGARRAFEGGLRIKTTLDLELQRAAEQAINGYLAYSGDPSAALVAIENSTGEVRAMVGGRNYSESPFNLATEGERQPGSSFKAFDLAGALEDGISPDSVWASKQKEFVVPHTGGHERFIVHNDEGAYSGENTLTGATAYSDNSIYAEVGLDVGTGKIAHLAHRMGITTPISTNPAMTIGGLKVGVTPLDMAHAYETIAHDGRRVSGTLAEDWAPVGIQEVASPYSALPDGSHRDVNQVKSRYVLPPSIASTETSVLETVLQYGTARSAALGQFAAGKTGTTSNYGDAWFVGWDSKYTVAVWVGYPNKLIPMTTQYDGGPVLGGTFPALIWHNFMTSALAIDRTRAAQAAARALAAKAGRAANGSSTTGEEALTGPPGGQGAGGQAQGATGQEGAGEHSEHGAQHPEHQTGSHAGGAEHGAAREHAASPAAPSSPAPVTPEHAASPSTERAAPEGGPPQSSPGGAGGAGGGSGGGGSSGGGGGEAGGATGGTGGVSPP